LWTPAAAGTCAIIAKADLEAKSSGFKAVPDGSPSRLSGAKPVLSFLSGFFPHDRNVSISLICNHLPAACQAGQNGGFRSAL
jgi:hypothetical protein